MTSAARVLIVGGGFAALEAALALRALAEERVAVTILSPDRRLRYRPAATGELRSDDPPRSYALEMICRRLGASYLPGALESVASRHHSVRLVNGRRLSYDYLVLAVGARPVVAIPGAWLFRDHRDRAAFQCLLGQLETGELERLVFAVPTGSSWPLPLYELALQFAAHARARGAEAQLSLATPEREPLAIFGDRASRAVAAVLGKSGVRFLGGVSPALVRGDGALELQADGHIAADAVVAIPQLRARRITGVPASWWGFVPTDPDGRVQELHDVYAAGDITATPVKQGGVAAAQADRVAHAIARELGVAVHRPDGRRVLRAQLVGGDRPVLLRAELDWRGRPTASGSEAATPLQEPLAAKVFGRYLTPFLQQLDAAAAAGAPRAA